MKKEIKDMYKEAARETYNAERDCYYYRGYTDGNALSLYVYEKYGVNAADSSHAHDALCEAQGL